MTTAAERARAERAAQGLPPMLEDPDVAARLARIIATPGAQVESPGHTVVGPTPPALSRHATRENVAASCRSGGSQNVAVAS